MRNHFSKAVLAFFAMLFATSLIAQQREITLEDIWGGSFTLQTMEKLYSMKDGIHYSVIETSTNNGINEINVYEYQSGKKTKTLIGSDVIPGNKKIDAYLLSEDESKILLCVDQVDIYRRSKKGIYYVHDFKENETTQLFEHPIQEPTFSPDGSRVAYVYNNNLYLKNFVSGETQKITNDGATNKIINGITDWVYEEEFAFVRAYEWSKDGKKIAFIRFDESDVPLFSMDIYGTQLYPTKKVFKYPKAGENNSIVSLHLYDVTSGVIKEIDLSSYEVHYMPRIKWTEDPDILSVQLLNRHQNILDLVFVDATDYTTELILRERDPAYIKVGDDLTFLNNNNFLWLSERGGWNHVYLFDRKGNLINQITDGPWEVTKVYGFNPLNGRIYYQSTENGSINRDVYSISRMGENKVRLTQGIGHNQAEFNANFSFFINDFSNTETPNTYTLHDGLDGRPLRVIKNNKAIRDLLGEYAISPKEFSTIDVNGQSLNMYMIKPNDFDSSSTYPLFMYQYSGPGSQKVQNTWNVSNDYWHQLLAQKGFVVVCVDGRGTGFKGRDFKKMTQLQLGKYEVEDQIAVAKKLGTFPYIDAKRIGIWGWSYGGIMASNCLFQGADTFSTAIAVAPVSSWRFYDTIYTERYMKTPEENPMGYDENSPLSHIQKLKGKFLLVHGSADDNVHFQNTMRLAESLIEANKNFDWLVYPDENHSIKEGNSRLHLYRKMTSFVLENLGKRKESTLELKQ